MEGGSQPATTVPKQAAYNKNEKSRDVRTTNIQAAKGKQLITQPSQTVFVQVLVLEAWIR